MKKILSILSIALFAFSALLLGGCGQQKDAHSVSIIFPGGPSGGERWEKSGKDLQESLQEEGFQATLDYGTADEQAQQIDKAISDGTSCIVISAADAKAISASLDKAKAKDIPVIAYDRLPMDTDTISYYATFDNEGIGEAMGKYVETKFNLKSGAGPYTIEFFQGSDDDNNAVLVDKGMMNILKPYLDKGQLVAASGQTQFKDTTIKSWDAKNAEARLQKLLSQYYNGRSLDIVMCASDSLSLGVNKALANYSGSHPFITGQDATSEALTAVKGGHQITLYKSASLLNAKCLRMIKAVLEGSQPALNDLSTYDNGAITVPSYLCTPLIIDNSNLDQVKN